MESKIEHFSNPVKLKISVKTKRFTVKSLNQLSAHANDYTYNNSKMCLRTNIFTNTTRRARQGKLERVQLELLAG